MTSYIPSSSTGEYRVDVARGVASVTLCRPDRLNALTFTSYVELAATFDALAKHDDVRSVLITGEGRGFCSGGDVDGIIAELFARDMKGLLEFTRITGNLIRSIVECARPVVAGVNGVCVGAGAVIAAACDLRIAPRKAKFGYIFPKVGLCGADMGAAWLLPRIVGRGNAMQLLLFGDVITGETAHRMGLVNALTDDADSCRALAAEWAEKLARGPAFAHSMTKVMVLKEDTMTLRDGLEAEAQAQAICMEHPDFRTAHDAFKAKEAPRFEGDDA
ncbi:MAG: enoyl-CoA hydratase/carnithine racemase [Myxococcota bacterium]|jgi:enoyl-CoA hydratase/carnithine racemase